MLWTDIKHCRICKSTDLREVWALADNLALSGYFPLPEETVPSGPLTLERCQRCKLVQLRETYAPESLYTETYGYRSSLNPMMVHHLQEVAALGLRWARPAPDDLVIDIGANDGTLLRQFPHWMKRWGVDPLGQNVLGRFYQDLDGPQCVWGYFSEQVRNRILDRAGRRPALITSVAMLYDLDEPQRFFDLIADTLAPGGIWISEQAWIGSMVRDRVFDNICHEHLEYYGLRQVRALAEAAGLKVLHVETDTFNCGVFRVVMGRAKERFDVQNTGTQLLADELQIDRCALDRFVRESGQCLADVRSWARQHAGNVAALGASTKGNIILGLLGLGPDDLQCVGEVNPSKFGRVTPGTRIPIVPEEEVTAEHLLVLPWAFRDFFAEQIDRFVPPGGSLAFPLPSLEIVSR